MFLHSAKVLNRVASAHRIVECISALKLKQRKTILIPLNFSVEDPCSFLSSLVLKLVPRWSEVKVAMKGVYLGATIGPGTTEDNWYAPVAKWFNRGKLLAMTAGGCAATVVNYNIRAVTCVSYVAQLFILPAHMVMKEPRMFAVIASR